MARRRAVALLAVVGLAAAAASSPQAKFGMTLVVEPARPVAGDPTRVTIRTDVPLAARHGIRMHAVGPWRDAAGQALLEIRLRRVAPRTLKAVVRFPYPGRWHLDIPASAASPPLERWLRVRPQS